MGEGAVLAAVADSGPIIHLHEIGQLPLLGMFSDIAVAEAVWQEVVGSQRVPEARLRSLAFSRHSAASAEVARIRDSAQADALQRGELEALSLCRQLNVNLLLTDDLAARTTASSLGIRPVGSLGVIVRAAYQRTISRTQAEDYLRQLYDGSSLFVTRALVDFAIDQLRQLS